MATEHVTAGDLRSSQLVASLADYRELAFLPPLLNEAGYTEAGLRELLRVEEISVLTELAVAGAAWRCEREGSRRSILIRLLLLGETAPADEVFDPSQLDVLLRKRILRKVDGGYQTAAALYPCEWTYVLTDLKFFRGIRNPVYELGLDSYALARLAYRKPCQDVLDVCTGSGIHAILAAAHSETSTGIDINPRAVTFAKVNAALNGVHKKVRILEGNLYAPIGEQTFDLILTNPPFVPGPDVDMDLHRWGGEDGEDLVRRIVAGLNRHLRPGGTFCMVTQYPIMTTSTYIERIASWLETSGWGISLLHLGEIALEGFITAHMPPSSYIDYSLFREQYRRWMDTYARLHIDRIGWDMIYVRRLPEGRPSYSAERSAPLKPADRSADITQWLDALERWHDPAWSVEWENWKPQCLGRLFTSPDGDSILESDTQHRLSAEDTALLQQADGSRTAAAVAEALGATRERLAERFHSLAVRGLLA